MFKNRFTFYLVAIVVIGALILLLLPPHILDGRSDKGYYFSRTKLDINNINIALSEFQTAFKVFPTGDNRAIFRALSGSNPLQIAFTRVVRTNSDGELLDVWDRLTESRFWDRQTS